MFGWILLVLVVIILGLVLYLFIAPFFLEINNTKGIYRVRFHHLARADLRFINDSVYVDLKILWINKQIDLLEQGMGNKKKKEKTIKKSEGKKIPWRKIKGVIKSFKWNRCNVSVDTGDMPTNGILYPLFYWIARITEKNISINFSGETIIDLQIKNSLARISWAFIKS